MFLICVHSLKLFSHLFPQYLTFLTIRLSLSKAWYLIIMWNKLADPKLICVSISIYKLFLRFFFKKENSFYNRNKLFNVFLHNIIFKMKERVRCQKLFILES